MSALRPRQLPLIPIADLLEVNWYYLYNPDQKPEKGTIFPVCQLLKIGERRCTIKVIGDIASRDAHPDELIPMVMIRRAEIANFAKGFAVPQEQLKMWYENAK